MKKFILLLAAFAALVSCTKENPVTDSDETTVTEGETIEIGFLAYAPGSESETPESKSVLASNGYSVLWEDGDEVVLHMNNMETKLKTSLSADSGQAYFSGEIKSDMLKSATGYAFYPSSVAVYKNASGYNRYAYNLSSAQTSGKNGSFGKYNLSSATIYATPINNGQGIAEFLNACAVIRISLPQDVKSVEVRSADSTPLSGEAGLKLTEEVISSHNLNGDSWVNKNDKNYRPSVDEFRNGSATVKLENGDELLKAGTAYNIVVWPGTHSDLLFTFTNEDGAKCVKSVGKEVLLEASKYALFDFKKTLNFSHVFEVETSALTLDHTEGSAEFAVTSSRIWTAESDQSWLKVSPASGVASADQVAVVVTAEDNTSTQSRSATVTVKAGEDTKTITVTQDGLKPELVVSEESLQYEAAGGSLSFMVTSNNNWTISDDADWLTIAPASGSPSSSETEVTAVAAENTTENERTATITITAGDLNKTLTVTQSAPQISVSLYYAEVNTTDMWNGVTVSSNVAWKISADQNWVSLGSASGVPVSKEIVSVNFDLNQEPTSRSVTFTVSNMSGTIVRTVTMTQPGVPREYKITSAAVDGAADLKDGQLYVICNRADASLYWSEADGKLVRASLSTSHTFSDNNVFVFHKDESLVTDEYKSAITYTSRNGGRFSSLSTGKYLDGSFGLNADSSQAQAFLLGNKWAYGGISADAEPGGEIDIIKGPWSGSEISIVYENNQYVFKTNGNITDVNTRKWVFYEVTEQ